MCPPDVHALRHDAMISNGINHRPKMSVADTMSGGLVPYSIELSIG